MANPIACYDFTINAEHIELEHLKTLCDKLAKKWCFQLERGEKTNYEHYQGRLSLKTKTRLTTLAKKVQLPFHWSATFKDNIDNFFYVMKDETRIDGPWMDNTTENQNYIPRQVREIATLYPWQQHIVDNYDEWDTRHINVIIDTKGNIGKSILITYMRAHHLAFKIPYCNDFRDIMRMVCDVPTQRCYVIDMPRAIKKDKLFQMFSAIEEIKNGYAYDDRYHFKEKIFDCPNIWIFMNCIPSLNLLSRDRWRLWEVNDSHELIKITTEE